MGSEKKSKGKHKKDKKERKDKKNDKVWWRGPHPPQLRVLGTWMIPSRHPLPCHSPG